ncbi:MAG TPA: hypothetical protein VFS21_22660 [Roseiflexaceae bacterium]|nr:hypothetical protein [Roseiflexaceae bacterium]
MPGSSRPTVRCGNLHLPDGQCLALDTPQWDAWQAQALAFDVAHPAGDFLVAREKRQRGGLYWVARRYDQGRRASVYLGARVAAADLEHAATELAAKIDERPAAPPKPPPPRRVLSVDQLSALVGDSSPHTMRALLDQLLAAETDPARRAALEALRRLVTALWEL